MLAFFCEHGKLIWLLSIGLWGFVWIKLWHRSTKGSFFFRKEYPALIGYVVLSFIVLMITSEKMCWCETCN
jgi:hypothetical protein